MKWISKGIKTWIIKDESGCSAFKNKKSNVFFPWFSWRQYVIHILLFEYTVTGPLYDSTTNATIAYSMLGGESFLGKFSSWVPWWTRFLFRGQWPKNAKTNKKLLVFHGCWHMLVQVHEKNLDKVQVLWSQQCHTENIRYVQKKISQNAHRTLQICKTP